MSGPLRRVLCVEDDPDIQAIAWLALERLGGLEVRVCSRGTEVLEALEGFDAQLLLLDVMMPALDGEQTLRRLRSDPRHGALPVIFMTAKVDAGAQAHYRALGAIGVIAKPFDPMRLADEVRRLWSARAT